VIAFDMKGSISYKVAAELAERAGIGSRWGCHCAHMLIKHQLGIPSWGQQIQRLIVILLPRLELPGVTRVSFGLDNAPADVDLLVQVLGQVAREGPARRKALHERMEAFVQGAVQRVYGEDVRARP
jgi:selenocysteine lyase/cysteine desulfurase